MKKLIIIVGMIWTGSALAEFSPPTSMDDYKDVYNKIYKDTFSETEDEILERVSEHKWTKDADLSLADIKTMWRLNVSENYAEEVLEFDREKQIKYSNKLQKSFNEEREILQFENSLRRKNKLLSIFSNDTNRDSPFDLLLDLYDIDEVLFGNEANDPDPSFKEKYSGGTAFRTTSFDNTEENWQDERPDGKSPISSPNSTKGPSGDCISQHITDLIPELIELESMPLKQGCDAHSIFEPSFETEPSSGSKNKNSKIISKTFKMEKSQLESEIVKKENPVKEFSSTISKILFDSTCEEKVESEEGSQLKTSYRIMNTVECEKKIRDEFADKLLEWRFEANFDVELEHRARIEESYEKFYSELKYFYESVKRLWESTFDYLDNLKFRS
ncbi:MAG: hypothetical protein OEL89_02685 [Candidatus Peregrinibacteria bacterium]|nr:hypothetical protein [Candidatus Peregrinibacteria bacterium]